MPTPPGEILAQTAHRSWPLPRGAWLMAQTWRKLLFAHWALPPEAVRPLVPAGLQLDTFDGQAWVGVVPFYITDLRAHFLPPIPFTSSFVEMNVRTYVVAEGKPGVWFFSLDASNRLAVEAARLSYHLPYFIAKMQAHAEGDTVRYRSERKDSRSGAGIFEGSYRPVSPVYAAESGSLDAWLTERYCLYSESRGRLYRADIHHVPWSLQRAEATIARNTAADAHKITLPDTPPLLHYSETQDVLVWPLTSLNIT